MQVLAAVFVLMSGVILLQEASSVSVVRVPRVYNVLIRSDGALAPSEAVSADSVQREAETMMDSGDDDENPPREELPILDPKMGALQDNVNYTAVPLSRAYPLTRYTAPLLAPLSYLAPLHGGLILGPIPRLHTIQEPQQQQQQQQLRSLPRGAFEDPDRDSVAVEASEEEQ